MKPGEIHRSLATTNRWWSHPAEWTGDDPDLRNADRAPFHYRAGVLSGLTPGGLYVLRGPRRVGKSVEVKRAIVGLLSDGVHPRRIVHMSMEGWSANRLHRLVDAAQQLTLDGPRYWFLDEITGMIGSWPQRIKWLRDNDPRFQTDTVVLTGSSSADLREAVGVLAGRRGAATTPDRVLLPMGFRDFVALVANGKLPEEIGPLRIDTLAEQLREACFELAPWLGILVNAWEIYLWVGGFPLAVSGYLREREVDPALWRGLWEVISGDAFRRARQSDLQTKKMLQRLAAGLGSPVNVARIARATDVTPTTAQQRIDNLREAFVVWPCYKEEGLRPRLQAQKKIYFTDPVYRLLTSQTTDLSVLSEQQLGMALLRSLERENPGSYVHFDRVLHHRTKAGREIDFVGPDFGDVAIESKYVDDDPWRHSEGRILRASPWLGIVATRNLLDLDDRHTLAVPAAMIAWLLDTQRSESPIRSAVPPDLRSQWPQAASPFRDETPDEEPLPGFSGSVNPRRHSLGRTPPSGWSV